TRRLQLRVFFRRQQLDGSNSDALGLLGQLSKRHFLITGPANGLLEMSVDFFRFASAGPRDRLSQRSQRPDTRRFYQTPPIEPNRVSHVSSTDEGMRNRFANTCLLTRRPS